MTVELRQMVGLRALPKGRTEEVKLDQDSIYLDGRWIGTAHRVAGGPIVIHRPPAGFSEVVQSEVRRAADARDGGEFPNRIVRVIWPEAEPELWIGSSEKTESWL